MGLGGLDGLEKLAGQLAVLWIQEAAVQLSNRLCMKGQPRVVLRGSRRLKSENKACWELELVRETGDWGPSQVGSHVTHCSSCGLSSFVLTQSVLL